MTEAEWLSCTDPGPMLEFLGPNVSGRKIRLFTCACCRRIGHLLRDRLSGRAVESIEQVAEGRGGEGHLRQARAAAEAAWDTESGTLAYEGWAQVAARAVVAAVDDPERAAADAATAAAEEAWAMGHDAAAGYARERGTQCALLRCIFANPFRPVALNPTWLTLGVQGLAQAAYDERQLPEGTLDPARLALLADALEDAGCTNAELLGHLRSGGPHVRGCWALDLVLGKA